MSRRTACSLPSPSPPLMLPHTTSLQTPRPRSSASLPGHCCLQIRHLEPKTPRAEPCIFFLKQAFLSNLLRTCDYPDTRYRTSVTQDPPPRLTLPSSRLSLCLPSLHLDPGLPRHCSILRTNILAPVPPGSDLSELPDLTPSWTGLDNSPWQSPPLDQLGAASVLTLPCKSNFSYWGICYTQLCHLGALAV